MFCSPASAASLPAAVATGLPSGLHPLPGRVGRVVGGLFLGLRLPGGRGRVAQPLPTTTNAPATHIDTLFINYAPAMGRAFAPGPAAGLPLLA